MRRPKNLKKYPTCFDKTIVFTQYRQNKWEIFSNFCCLFRKAGLYYTILHLLYKKVFFNFFFRQMLSKVRKVLLPQQLQAKHPVSYSGGVVPEVADGLREGTLMAYRPFKKAHGPLRPTGRRGTLRYVTFTKFANFMKFSKLRN